MKFFFAENCDTVDPNFDFGNDSVKVARNRSEDQFAHEFFETPPYDGLLVSRALIEDNGSSNRYTQPQKQRIFREGIRDYLRYPIEGFKGDRFQFPIMGDCGSYSYINKTVPPIGARDTLDFYVTCGFEYGVSPDHIIKEHNPRWDDLRKVPSEVQSRWDFTVRSAKQFLDLSRSTEIVPVGSVQSWSPRSAAKHAMCLVEMGYSYVGLGGIAARRTEDIFDIVSEVRSVIPRDVKLHLFGFNRINHLEQFSGMGIDSFDSTSPMLKAFKDDEFNYFCPKGDHYLAVRIPHRDDATLKNRIQSGQLNDETVRILESSALEGIRLYDEHRISVNDAVERLLNYELHLSPEKNQRSGYLRTLGDRPWETCLCPVCRQAGIDVILHRGLNRHKRRGFHNLWVFHERLKKVKKMKTIKVQCIRIQQSPKRHVYSFAANGKDIGKFASISRIKRDDAGQLVGYQRSEILDHVEDIRTYLEQDNAVLPNSLVIAFDRTLEFNPHGGNEEVATGTLEIPLDDENIPGWVVDGQQRLAALRRMSRKEFWVSVVAIESTGVQDEREQFVLVNSTRPLPKSLVYELLPSIGDAVPPRMRKRQRAYQIMELMAGDAGSPFYQRIRTTTSGHLVTANIKDVSVLKMIENSMENGALSRHPEGFKRPKSVLLNYWTAVARMFPEAWKLPPRRSRLTHGAGLVSMGYLMDAIAFRLASDWVNPPIEAYEAELEKLGADLPWYDGVWNLSQDVRLPWNEIQNTARHIDLVTNYLIRRYRKVRG